MLPIKNLGSSHEATTAKLVQKVRGILFQYCPNHNTDCANVAKTNKTRKNECAYALIPKLVVNL